MPLSRRSLLASAACVVAAPHVARAAPRALTLGLSATLAAPSGVGCTVFAKAVADHPLLKSALRVDVRDNGAVGDENAMLKSCMDGVLDLAVVGTTTASSVYPDVGLLDAPFLFANIETARAAVDGAAGQDLFAGLKSKGIYALAWSENGLRHVTANRPIRSPADLAGLKLRVPPSEVMQTSFKALGADVQTVPFLKIYESLRTGDVDAQENPVGLIETLKLYEVQKFISLTAHIYSCSALIVSPDVTEDLSADQVKALAACARAGTAAARNAVELAEKEGLGRLREKGMAIVSDIDVAAFQAMNRPNLKTIGTKINPGLMDRLTMTGGAG